jgi:hypothetical protein
MKRRLFLKASATTALAAPAMTASALGVAGAARAAPRADRFFYDDRFEEAQALAARLGAGAKLAVSGDVTLVWTGGLSLVSRETALTLEGVTTESFYFCLKTLLQPHAALETQIARATKDLHVWSIRSNPQRKTG